MKLIIDIPDNVIESAKSSPNYYQTYQFEKIWKAIVNGTPLDKIRAEMEQIAKGEPKYVNGVMNCLEIIDMHIKGNT